MNVYSTAFALWLASTFTHDTLAQMKSLYRPQLS